MMSDPKYLLQSHCTTNEPKIHPLVRKSFAFVPSVGMRLAPEVLVLEFMREIFFSDFSDEQKAKALDPNEKDGKSEYCYSKNERAVLFALRGRRKKTKASLSQPFFAPAYPSLAESAWLRRREARVINNFLLGGPIAQSLWHKGPGVRGKKVEQREIAEQICRALQGAHSYFEDPPEGKEILAVTLGKGAFGNSFGPQLDHQQAVERLKEKTTTDSVMRIKSDELAYCITSDMRAICELEANLPRMQWLHILMTFLRFALPMWLLGLMRITDLLHKWLLDSIDHNAAYLSISEISKMISERNKGLLHSTLTPTRELFDCIDGYMKRRVELSILLYCIEQVRPNLLEGKKLSLNEKGKDMLGVEQLLVVARESASDLKAMEHFKSIAKDHNVATFLTREGEKFPGWRNPLMRGQGKNIDEFFRVLYKAEEGDEAGGYLLAPVGRAESRGFRVFPGQLLLKTLTYLAATNKQAHPNRNDAGKLVLQDVENRFAQYGVDFSSSAGARPLLMKELQSMGLLAGSPDAGSDVAVANPY